MKVSKEKVDLVLTRLPLSKLWRFMFWIVVDIYRVIKYGRKFNEYGLTLYCGRQGAGKTVAMTEYLERMRLKYPEALIITNYGFINQTKELESWEDFLKIRNGDKGVIFALDEIQNEWDSTKWSNFPESLLREITQQRKQKIKIVATAQVYTRVVKQLREQCFEVVECFTAFGRWTFCKCFDADDYNAVIDCPDKKNRLSRKWRRSFIQTDNFRKLFDTYLKIEKIKPEELTRNTLIKAIG